MRVHAGCSCIGHGHRHYWEWRPQQSVFLIVVSLVTIARAAAAATATAAYYATVTTAAPVIIIRSDCSLAASVIDAKLNEFAFNEQRKWQDAVFVNLVNKRLSFAMTEHSDEVKRVFFFFF